MSTETNRKTVIFELYLLPSAPPIDMTISLILACNKKIQNISDNNKVYNSRRAFSLLYMKMKNDSNCCLSCFPLFENK